MAIILYNPKAKSSNIEKALRRFKASRNNADDIYKDITKTDDLLSIMNGSDPVFLIGGDGTINHFINRSLDLMPYKQPLHLEPAGTGNDFYRSLKSQNPLETSLMDVSFNQKERVYINGMGIGIDGYIGLRVNKHKKKTSFTYFIETIKALIYYKPSTCKVRLDNQEMTFKKAYLVVASNGMYFGGGMKITPHAKCDDDLLDVLIVHNISRIKILLIFISIYFGKHLSFKKHVFNQKGKSLEVTYEDAQVMQTDGETFENVTHFITQYSDKKAAIRLKR